MSNPASTHPPVFVAVVNDDRTVLTVVTELLDHAGFSVLPFASASAALQGLDRERPPDVIVTDLNMPGIDGFRFCRLLRTPEYAPFNTVPILVLSGTFSGEEAARVTADLGANGFLPAPVRGHQLVTEIRALLAGRPAVRGPRVLIVEDGKTLAAHLGKSFSEHGYAAQIVHDGNEGLRKFSEDRFEVVILDYHLPDRNGDELLAEFMRRHPTCICIMMTTDPSPEHAVRWMTLGASAYVRKPFETAYLLELCGKARRERTLMGVVDRLEERTRQLQESESLLRLTQRLAGIGGWSWDVQHNTGRWTEEVFSIHEMPVMPETIITRTMLLASMDCYDPDDRARIAAAFQCCVEKGVPYALEARFTGKRGRRRWVHTSGEALLDSGKVVSVMGTIMDITARKEAEQAKAAAQTLLEEAFRQSSVAMVLVSVPDGILRIVNPACHECLGVSPTETQVGMRISEVKPAWVDFDADGRRMPFDQLPLTRAMRGETTINVHNRVVRADGSERWVLATAAPIRNGTNEIIAAYLIMNDITEQKRIEKALRESESKFRAYFELPLVGIAVSTPDKKWAEVNQCWCDMLGYPRAELLQKTWVELTHPDDFNNDMTLHERVERGEIEGFTLDKRFIRKDGAVIWTSMSLRCVRNDDGSARLFFTLFQDLTERKRAEDVRLSLERQIQHAQKLESLGVLAGGIAHDFNNILMAILGNSDLALMQLSPMSAARANLQEIQIAAKRAAELSKQMMAYSGKGKFVIEPIDLGELVQEMGHLLEVSISKKVVLKYNLSTKLPRFDGDVTQVRQIIMNLITNASEAIGEKSGVIALTTGAMDCDRTYLNSVSDAVKAGLNEPLPEGVYTYIEVADTGCGMDADTMTRIFDPFFTTKFTGRGLGMSAVLGIVRGHGGAIKVYSEVGRGTTFKVLFPARKVPTELNGLSNGNTTIANDWRGQGTILIADDEETVCAVGKQMVEYLGFKAITAIHGKHAVDLFREHHPEIVCVLLDLTMPKLDGEQTFRELRRIKPDIPVILCSGYNEQDATERFVGKGLAGFIQKPFTFMMLSKTLQEVLGQKREG